MFRALVHATALTAHAAAFATPPLPRLQRPQVSIATSRVANPIQAVHVDLTDPNTFAVFFLWGSPVPLLFQAMIRDTEDGKDNPPGIAEPFNMGYAFPSFQARMKQPTEPKSAKLAAPLLFASFRFVLVSSFFLPVGSRVKGAQKQFF